jgi:aquaporin Z
MQIRKLHPLLIYAMDGMLLGCFMISACVFAALLEHPASHLHQALPDALLRRALMGIAMGVTAVALIYSRWGRRTGALMNPAVTLSAWMLGRISGRDAVGYITGQFAGALGGVALMALVAARWMGDSSVNYVATLPGRTAFIAWLAEAAIAFGMMGMSLALNRFPRVAPYTGCFAGILLALYITLEAPISGMSLNPARSFGSAFWAHAWVHLWIYFTAPVAGMLAAVQVSRRFSRMPRTLCCKFNHSRGVPCHCPCRCLGRGSANTPSNADTHRSNAHVQVA